jgi:beta-lactamase superfamily II metal-dependent hydrolase
MLASAPAAQTKPSKSLDIYLMDAEGGKAVLFVSPSGETVLIDVANPVVRDTERIMAMLTEAGVKQIDHLILTHYHVDHVGGLPELAKRVPIKHFVDHGPSVEEREQVAGFQAAYAEIYGKAKHTVAKPGDKLPVAGLDWRIVTSAGKAITAPLAGAGKPNAACASFTPRPATNDPENGQSVGSVITFGKFRTIDLGDLLWDNEKDFMCPNNLVGTVDLYIASHHGIDASGSAALVHGLQPRVAIEQNGTRKGGTVQTNKTIYASPGFEDLWQMHWSYNAGTELNPAGLFIANIDEPAVVAAVLTAPPGGGRGGPGAGTPPTPGGIPPPASVSPGAVPPPVSVSPGAVPTPMSTPVTPPAGAVQSPAAGPGQPGVAPPAGAPGGRQGGGGRGGPGQPHIGPAFLIKVSAQADGTFTVTNTRNGFTRTYKAR